MKGAFATKVFDVRMRSEEDTTPTMYLDAETRSKLTGLKQMTEFRDENDQLVGHYVPALPPCPWEPDLSETEIQRRIAEPRGTTLAEFWRQQGAA